MNLSKNDNPLLGIKFDSNSTYGRSNLIVPEKSLNSPIKPNNYVAMVERRSALTWNDRLKIIDKDFNTFKSYIGSQPPKQTLVENNVQEYGQKTFSDEEADVVSEDLMDNMNMPAGMLLNEVNTVFTNSENNRVQLNANMGTSASGHAPDYNLQAQHQIAQNNIFSDARTLEITLGSAFGLEGLAAGSLAALVTQNWFGGSNIPDIQGTSGNMVDMSTISE